MDKDCISPIIPHSSVSSNSSQVGHFSLNDTRHAYNGLEAFPSNNNFHDDIQILSPTISRYLCCKEYLEGQMMTTSESSKTESEKSHLDYTSGSISRYSSTNNMTHLFSTHVPHWRRDPKSLFHAADSYGDDRNEAATPKLDTYSSYNIDQNWNNNSTESSSKTVILTPMKLNESSTTSTSKDFIKPQKLLIVDDVPTSRKMLSRLFESRGHYCEEAADGLIALNMVKNLMSTTNVTNSDSHTSESLENFQSPLKNYDVILMDFVMPTMNGPNATRAIRELGYTGPIIGVTGNALTVDKTIFMNSGATAVIIKPLRINVLLKIIDL